MKRSVYLSDHSRPSKGMQYPETIDEFGRLEPVCQVCGRQLKQGYGLVSYAVVPKTREMILSTVTVTCKGRCDNREARPYSREADWVFANLAE